MMIRPLRLFALLLTAAWLLPAMAGPVEITQKPLIVANPDAVKANLLFVIDDSGSMAFDYLPDHVTGVLCRSSGAVPENSGNFSSRCCIGGSDSAACWLNDAPFGTNRGQPPFLAAGFNGAAYDPAVVYKPPVKADGTSWASQTSAVTNGWKSVKNDAYNVQNTNDINLLTEYPDTEWCVDDGTFSDCLRNDNYVLPGTVNGKAYTKFNATVAYLANNATGRVATGAPDNASIANRKFGPHYYQIVPAEYCTSSDLRTCRAQAGDEFVIPAPVRWCNTDENARKSTPDAGSCQATRNGNYSNARYPTKFFSAGTNAAGRGSSLTFTVAPNCTSTKVVSYTSLKINGVERLSSATATSNNANSVATNIVARLVLPTGWTVSRSNATITITAPVTDGSKTGQFASFTTATSGNNGSCSPSPNGNNAVAFANDYVPYRAPVPGSYAGRFERVDIHPDTATYSRPASRTDCAGIGNSGSTGSCSYAEEMTNFANWWTYYHTRMQAMKTSASLAFGEVGNNRRVGYMSINNATKSDFVNLDTFENSHRANWFTKLTAAYPNGSTPLRGALSKAGRLYAGKLNGTNLNGTTVTDPIQYSCQRNATILSTDGYWNNDVTPTRPDGKEVGDVDSAANVERPMYDGTNTQNTLADTAYYYNKTDLRDSTVSGTVCTNSGTDICYNGDRGDAPQVMMTFTLGLGVSGYMQFAKNYLTGGSADFNAVKNGAAANGSTCSWQSSGNCNWPVPANNSLTAVDDLWHAAVNGSGTYFSATDPTSLYTGLRDALRLFDAKTGAAAAATTSNPNVTSGDNKAFVSDFTSSQWTGQLQSKAIDLDDGQLRTVNWKAAEQLDAATSRRVLMFDASVSGSKLKNFDYGVMGAEKAYFETAHITATGRALTQFCSGPSYCVGTTGQTAAAGKALVDYLRGDRTNEGELEDGTKYFRKRVNLLGDIVNSEAVYVNKQLVNYADSGYSSFKNESRRAMVYVGANDGMLHAFDANTGAEVWAYVPTAVLPNLYKLADKQYATNHQYFVDATPFAQDVKIGGAWRTILVGGLGGGGRSYYALDITDPDNPKALWEFGVTPADTTANCTGARCNMGYTFGQPEIGKLLNGTWVVVVPSGYNNTSPGDGKARLFVLDATTGQPVSTLPTGVVASAGDGTTPAGLGHIRAWVEDANLDNTIQRVYGGDNLGNVWRFEVNSSATAVNLAILKNAAGTAQPVTSRPELGQVNGLAMVYVGTGRYMGQSDLSDGTRQSIYAIKDELKATGHGEVRAGGKFIQQTLGDGTCPTGVSWCRAGQTVRTTTKYNAVNLAQDGGWFVDLPQDRERVNNDPLLVLGTLIVTSNVIQPGDLCKAGGSSWVNYFDYTTGQATSVSLGDVLVSRPNVYLLPNGKLIGLARDSAGGDRYFDPPINPTVGDTRRISWRDLQQQ